jgi:hypothetical protein
MKSNEDYLKELYSNVLLSYLNKENIIENAIKSAKIAINDFSNQFESKEILKPLDYKYIRIFSTEQELDVLNGLVKMRNFRFKGCSLDYSIQKIPSVELGGFPYWIFISDNGTIEIETKNPN